MAKLFDELSEKRTKLDEFAARLRKDYPQYAALQYPKPCTLEEARSCLADDEVAVLFDIDRKESYAVVVQKKPGAQVTLEELLAFYDGKVAKWWIPDDVVFVDALPHTATGKLLKTKLREQYGRHVLPGG